MNSREEEIIKTIITRLKGVIDEEKAGNIYEASGITVNNDDDVKMDGKPNVILDKLLRNLLKDANYLVKITLHNIAQDNKLNICPLCQEVNETENAERKDKTGEEDDKNKDLSVKMLHSTASKKIILISLRNEATLNDHAADCPIMVLCVSGQGTFEYDGKTDNLKAGDLINLDARVVHNVQAKNALEILVTKILV